MATPTIQIRVLFDSDAIWGGEGSEVPYNGGYYVFVNLFSNSMGLEGKIVYLYVNGEQVTSKPVDISGSAVFGDMDNPVGFVTEELDISAMFAGDMEYDGVQTAIATLTPERG